MSGQVYRYQSYDRKDFFWHDHANVLEGRQPDRFVAPLKTGEISLNYGGQPQWERGHLQKG